ncbi:MAG: DUF4012 domain-containing protein [Anaerolineae bacterium]|nr:DUF4012 domain-containing protein [Anaerolineae bacterium]
MKRLLSLKFASRLLVAAGSILLLVWAVQMAMAAQSLRGHLAQAEALAGDPTGGDVAAACDLARDLRADVVTLRRGAGGLARLAPALGWLPGVGGDLRAAPHLLAVADGLTEAGQIGCDALAPTLATLAGGDVSLPTATSALAAHQPDLVQALAAVERAHTAWAAVDPATLSPWLAGKVSILDRGLPLLRAGLAAATLAPDLLGLDAPRTYLLLALNEDEERAVGGYITGVGEVRVTGGQIAALTFNDSYAVDDFSLPYPDAPEPLRRYMDIDLWVFRDSNWSPDFPTVARRAIDLYRPGYPVTIDGVVALDQIALQALVEALEPLDVAGVDEPVTGETVVAVMRQAWAPENGDFSSDWWAQRKSFLGDIAAAAWERVQTGQVDWLALARTLRWLLDEKHLLVYAQQPQAASILADLGWDGALRPAMGDYLAVFDTNVGYNRASARVQRALDYRVDLALPTPQATLTLVYTHTSTADTPCIHHVYYAPVYEQMMDTCYWDYVRVYVPQGSTLLDATRIPVPGESLLSGEDDSGAVTVLPAEEGPWLTFGALGLLPTATTHTRRFVYTLPDAVVAWAGETGTYTLRVQKQAGSVRDPLTVRVRLPAGAALVASTPEPAAVEEGWIVYQLALATDVDIHLRFRR